MPLPAGSRLGSYDIIAPLGAGGMGEVYRARDPKLGREVAVKIMTGAFAADSEQLARFEREAQAVASLSHPNILAVYEFGMHGGQPFVAMELLEGETLRERLAQGPLPVRKAIDVATQIARGLAAAHDKNLIHRDLKPENVFLLADGQVKILDFGLAKALGRDGPGGIAGSGAAETVARTDPGTVLGTVGYMAPEQVRAGVVDGRADLFALGVVLHEMLTGVRTFQRPTAAEVMTAILREDPPDLLQARPDLPPALDRIVQHALEKNPVERFQTARDVVFALTSLSGSTAAASGSAASMAPIGQAGERGAPARFSPAVLAAAALVVAAAAAGGWWAGRRGPAPAERWDQFVQLTDEAGEETGPRISPDGSSFAYASRAKGSWDIYVQRVGGRQPLAVAASPTRDELWPAFSPDGRSIAFNESDADGGIFITGATGESERRLTDFGANPSWSPDGRSIVFATEEVDSPYGRLAVSTLWVVDVAGGAPRQIHKSDAVQPAWSPSGRRIAFWANTGGVRDIFTVAADGSDRVAVTNDVPLNWSPVWSPDGRYLYFASDRGGSMGLWRIAIDEATGRTQGVPESVSAGVEASMDLPSFSADGKTLLFRSRLMSVNPAMIAFDPVAERAGETRVLLARTGILTPTSVSPDGAWLALMNQGEAKEDISLLRTDGSGLRRLTDDVARDRFAIWTGDGKALSFYSNRSGRYTGWSIRTDGSGLTQLIAAPDEDLNYVVFSPAGDRVLAETDDQALVGKPPFPIAWKDLTPLPNITVPGGHLQPTLWSPDGRYLSGTVISGSGAPIGVGVYDFSTGKASKLSDDQQVWAAPFLPDSKRVVAITLDNRLLVIDVATGKRRVVPVTLPLPAGRDGVTVAPDGHAVYYGAMHVEANVWMATTSSARR